MNIDPTITRQPLGHALVKLEEWQRMKIKGKLKSLGVTQGQWQRLMTYAEAHKVPTFIRDAIVDELPDMADLFNHPNAKSEKVA